MDTNKHVVKTIVVFIMKQFLVSFLEGVLTELLTGERISTDVRDFIGDLIGVLLAVLLVVTIVNGLKIRAASFTTLLTSTNITVNVTLSKGLRGFTNKLVMLLFHPFGMNS